MLAKSLIRHAAEFKRYLSRHKYDVTPEGLYFPQARTFVAGEYFFDTNGQAPGSQHNLVPAQGLNYMLDTALRNQAQQPDFFLALYSGAYTPNDGLTAATFSAAANEIVSNTTGYTEATRQPWIPAGPAAAGILSNVVGGTDNKASFTIKTATTLVIRGAALLSDSAKGGGGGVLISAARFSADRTHYDGDVFNLGYRVRARAE